MGNIGKHRAGSLDSGDIGRVVKRRQVLDRLDGIQNLFVDQDGAGKLFAAVHDPVTDR